MGDRTYLELDATELKLGLPQPDVLSKKRKGVNVHDHQEQSSDSSSTLINPTMSPVVGWPPVRSYRRNHIRVNHQEPTKYVTIFRQISALMLWGLEIVIDCIAQTVGWPPVKCRMARCLSDKESKSSEEATSLCSSPFVKVSMDGAPFLRKVNLKLYNSYQHLSNAIHTMFPSLPSANNGETWPSSFVPTYEDKDGDWMLVGDVPWEMFVDSCKRMRIMKAEDINGNGNGIDKNIAA